VSVVPASSFLTRLSDRLGLPDLRQHTALVVALCVDAIGSGVAGPLLLLYLTRVAGLRLGPAGVLLTASAAFSLVVPAIIGRVTHRLGARRIVVGAQLLQALAMVVLLISHQVPVLGFAAMLAAIGQRAFWSSVFVLVADAAESAADDRDHDRWFAASGMIQNAGFAIGGLLAGALLLLPGPTPFVVALSINAVSFLGSGLLFARDRARPHADQPHGRQPRSVPDGRYLLLILANTSYAFCSVLLGVGLPLYALDFLHAPAWLIGPLLALVTVLGATGQGVGVRRTERLRRVTVLGIAGALWVVWGLLMAGLTLTSGAVLIGGLVVATVLYAVAELLHAPASMSLSATQAPAVGRETYLAWFQYSFAIATVLSPSVFGLLSAVRPNLPWLIASAAAALAILLARGAVGGSGNRVSA
jgi:MFS family permease